jgi:hypothetical protein
MIRGGAGGADPLDRAVRRATESLEELARPILCRSPGTLALVRERGQFFLVGTWDGFHYTVEALGARDAHVLARLETLRALVLDRLGPAAALVSARSEAWLARAARFAAAREPGEGASEAEPAEGWLDLRGLVEPALVSRPNARAPFASLLRAAV